MLTVVQAPIPTEAIQYIEEHRALLTPDHSQYANEWLRAWVGAEAPLTDNRTFTPAPFDHDSRLWIWLEKFCQTYLNFTPEIALLHVGGADCSDPEEAPPDGHGGECGIRRHRDAAYADYRAVGINLVGEATFGYQSFYPEQDKWTAQAQQNKDAKLEHVNMTAGTCVVLNCKNPHFAQVGPNRWCINAWRISTKRRAEFEAWRKAQ
jgi:hypothetical protein